MSVEIVDTSIIETADVESAPISFVLAEDPTTPYEPPPLFPSMTEETYNTHVHHSKVVSLDLLPYTKVDLTPDNYFRCLKEYIDVLADNNEGLFSGWDLDRYTIYYLTRVANENRNSVRNNWEAMGKALHKAEWFEEQRYNLPEDQDPYHELLNDTIYREGM